MAAKVCDVMDLTTEEIEEELPLKSQRELLEAIVSLHGTERAQLNYNLWVLRAAATNNLESKLWESSGHSKHHHKIDQQLQMQPDKLLQNAVHYLVDWNEKEEKSGHVSERFYVPVHYWLANYFMDNQNYAEALKYYNPLLTISGSDNKVHFPPSVNMKQVNHCIKVCNYALSPKDNSNFSQSMMIQIENICKCLLSPKTQATEPTKNMSDDIEKNMEEEKVKLQEKIIELLKQDLLSDVLSGAYRDSLLNYKALENIKQKILILNLLWTGIREDISSIPIGLIENNTTISSPIFTFLSETVLYVCSNYSKMALSIRSSLSSSPFGPDGRTALVCRLRILLFSLMPKFANQEELRAIINSIPISLGIPNNTPPATDPYPPCLETTYFSDIHPKKKRKIDTEQLRNKLKNELRHCSLNPVEMENFTKNVYNEQMEKLLDTGLLDLQKDNKHPLSKELNPWKVLISDMRKAEREFRNEASQVPVDHFRNRLIELCRQNNNEILLEKIYKTCEAIFFFFFQF
eukprot:TRINITY_DN3714_c3_g1_i1.p1 TRINITY_DN3714_c3_g1~~TRINITY_DN3714_c3_g1_i1.p1  ORF type:complete len:601 (+),score=146.91 TRINITY_DN3714_c3_g1_i1:249-1805(+)